MSRGFVKEDDLEHAGTDLPERPISEYPNYVTPEGLQQLQAQVTKLEKERLQLAPLKDDPISQQKIAMLERDLRYFSARLEQAILVDLAKQDKHTALFGARVTIEDEEGQIQNFTIVGEDEADIASHKVSWVSPLAKALIGHKVGESVVWKRPAGNLNLEIIEIN